MVGNVGNAPTTSAMSMQHSTFELIPLNDFISSILLILYKETSKN